MELVVINNGKAIKTIMTIHGFVNNKNMTVKVSRYTFTINTIVI